MRTFVLGMGAQKAGTTWLYRQLLKQERYVRPAQKELHVFDALYVEQYRGFRERVEHELSDLLLKGRSAYEHHFTARKFQMFLDQSEYFSYFDELIMHQNNFSSDLTPSYSALPVDVLTEIRESFDKRGIATRVIFLMREPITRLESALRRRATVNGRYDEITIDEMMSLMSGVHHSKQIQLRSTYRATVANIRRAFEPESIYLGFFETMFEGHEVERLAQFLSIDSTRFDTDTAVHKTNLKFRYPQEFVATMRQEEQDNYEFVRDELGFPIELWEAARSKITA